MKQLIETERLLARDRNLIAALLSIILGLVARHCGVSRVATSATRELHA